MGLCRVLMGSYGFSVGSVWGPVGFMGSLGSLWDPMGFYGVFWGSLGLMGSFGIL